MKIPLAFLGLLLLAGCASTQTYMGRRVINAPFAVAGGNTLSLPVTDAGPLPAENDSFKIEVAGFTVEPSKDNPKVALLIWRFSLTSKTSQQLERVLVEEISPSAIEKLIVEDQSPGLRAKAWHGASAPLEASRTSTPWLYDEKASIYVFRFTIQARGATPTVLHQPAWFSKPAKEQFRKHIERINGS